MLTSCVTSNAQLLTNSGYEGNFTTVAAGWHQITYGFSQLPVVSYSKETSVVFSGFSSQKIEVNNLGDGATLLVQDYDFAAGEIFEGTVWLKSADSIKIAFMFQERVPFYHVPAVYIKKIGPTWEKLTIQGGYKRNIDLNQMLIEGRFVIQPLDTGILYVDQSDLINITDSIYNAPVANAGPVPKQFFGMHVNKLGVHQTYPPLNFGTMRLWNTGTEWSIIEPWQGALNDPLNWIYDPTGNSGFGFRLDYYVNYILNADSNASILYTMGQTPSWASIAVSEPPDSISYWQNYASFISNRYVSQIKYWEIWNEADYNGSFSGNDSQLFALAQSGYQELKSVDSMNVVLTPNFTSAQGLAEFLYNGGGNFADIISWHDYPSRKPEESIPEILGMLNVMENYGFGAKPLWNTEGAVSFNLSDSLTEQEGMGGVARSYLIYWMFGVQNFNWYCWDVYGDLTKNFVELSASILPNQYDSTTNAGISYREIATWLNGSNMISKTENGNTWIVEIQRGLNYKGWIVWNTNGSTPFTIPSSWNILQERNLYGDTITNIPSSIVINEMPLLLENSLSTSTQNLEFTTIEVALIFPNPGNEYFAIKTKGKKQIEVTIFNSTGQIVERSFVCPDGECEVNTTNWKRGVYFITINSDSFATTRKFIKMDE